MIDWKPIAEMPPELRDGRKLLFWRPLAERSHDPRASVKRCLPHDTYCWPCTVPDGATPCNPTDGACHVTHYAEITEPGG